MKEGGKLSGVFHDMMAASQAVALLLFFVKLCGLWVFIDLLLPCLRPFCTEAEEGTEFRR